MERLTAGISREGIQTSALRAPERIGGSRGTIGGMQLGIARKYPNLVRILADFAFEPLETWVVMQGDLRGNPPVRVVFDELCAFLERYAGSRPETLKRPASR